MRASITSIFLAALVSLGAIPLFASALTFTRPLAYGSSGTDVSALQQYLKDQGYFHYPDITGYFGPYTWRAIAAFQWDNKLESVGYLGPKTELALNKLLDQSLASLATSTSAATPSSSPPAIPSLVSLPPPAPIYTTPPPTPAIGQPWHAPSGGGYAGGPPAAIPEPAPPPAPAPYVAKAVYFDGSTWLSTNNLSSTDNSFFSFSFWFKTSTVADAIIFWISDPNNYLNGFGYQRNGVNPAGNSLEFTLGNPTLGSVGYDSFSMDPPENVGTPFGSWHHAIGSFWGNNSGQIGAVKLYIDDIDVSPPQSWPIPNNPPGSVAYNTNIFGGDDDFIIPNINNTPFYFGSDTFGDNLTGDIADVWVAPGVSLLSGSGASATISEATRRKFIDAGGKPVDLDCSKPTGSAPAICFTGDASTFGTNEGTGGAFTTSGTLTDAASSPSN